MFVKWIPGIELFGTRHAFPIVLSPCGTQQAFHPEGELATARASGSRDCLQIMSTVSSFAVEEVNANRGAPVWFQLYATEKWEVTEGLVRRAEAAGCPAIALTVDIPVSNRGGPGPVQAGTRTWNVLHATSRGLENAARKRPMFDGLDLSGLDSYRARHLDWGFRRSPPRPDLGQTPAQGHRHPAKMPLSALEHGVDGLIVSNHGGRGENQRPGYHRIPAGGWSTRWVTGAGAR